MRDLAPITLASTRPDPGARTRSSPGSRCGRRDTGPPRACSRASRSTRSRSRARPAPRRSRASRPRRCSSGSRPPTTRSTSWLAVVEEGGYGAETAAPIVRAIIEGLDGLTPRSVVAAPRATTDGDDRSAPSARRRCSPTGGRASSRRRCATSTSLLVAALDRHGRARPADDLLARPAHSRAAAGPAVLRQAPGVVVVARRAAMVAVMADRLPQAARPRADRLRRLMFVLLAVSSPGIGAQLEGERRPGSSSVRSSSSRREFAKFFADPRARRLLLAAPRRPRRPAARRSRSCSRVVPIGLVMLQPDLGTDLVLGLIVFAMLAVGGSRGRHLVDPAAARCARAPSRAVNLGRAEAVPGRPADVASSTRAATRARYDLQPRPVEDRDRERRAHRARACSRARRPTARLRARAAHRLHLHRGGRGARLRRRRDAARAVRADRVAHLANGPAGRRPLRHPVCVGVLAMFMFQVFENVGMTMGIMPITGHPAAVHELRRLVGHRLLRLHRARREHPHAPVRLNPRRRG